MRMDTDRNHQPLARVAQSQVDRSLGVFQIRAGQQNCMDTCGVTARQDLCEVLGVGFAVQMGVRVDPFKGLVNVSRGLLKTAHRQPTSEPDGTGASTVRTL